MDVKRLALGIALATVLNAAKTDPASAQTYSEGDTVPIAVRLSTTAGSAFTVYWRVNFPTTENADPADSSDVSPTSGSALVPAGSTPQDVINIGNVQILADDIEEKVEVFEILLSRVELPPGFDPEQVALMGKITIYIAVDDSALERRKHVNKVLLEHVGSTLVALHLDRIESCIDRALTSSLPGEGSGASPEPKIAFAPNSDLASVSFATPNDFSAAEPTLCGAVLWRQLKHDGPVSWDGNLSGAHLGGNVHVGNGLLLGMEVSQDRADIDWRYAATGHSGDWRLSLSGIRPYAAWQLDDDARLWGMLGYGSGTIRFLSRSAAQRSPVRGTADVRQETIAVGGSIPIPFVTEDVEGISARLRGEAWSGKFEVAGGGRSIPDLSVRTRGARILLEGESRRTLESGGILIPSARVGVRYAGKEVGTAYVAGAGLRWNDRKGQLNAELDGHILYAKGHVREWGVSARLFHNSESEPGPSVRASMSGKNPDLTASELQDQAFNFPDEQTPVAPAFGLQAEWGRRVAGTPWVLTPFAGLEESRGGSQSLNLGMNLALNQRARLELRGVREENAPADQSDHRMHLVGVLKW